MINILMTLAGIYLFISGRARWTSHVYLSRTDARAVGVVLLSPWIAVPIVSYLVGAIMGALMPSTRSVSEAQIKLLAQFIDITISIGILGLAVLIAHKAEKKTHLGYRWLDIAEVRHTSKLDEQEIAQLVIQKAIQTIQTKHSCLYSGEHVEGIQYARWALDAISHSPDAALVYSEQAIKLAPQYASSYYARGKVHIHFGDEREAADDFRRTLELAPDHPNADEMLRHIAAFPNQVLSKRQGIPKKSKKGRRGTKSNLLEPIGQHPILLIPAFYAILFMGLYIVATMPKDSILDLKKEPALVSAADLARLYAARTPGSHATITPLPTLFPTITYTPTKTPTSTFTPTSNIPTRTPSPFPTRVQDFSPLLPPTLELTGYLVSRSEGVLYWYEAKLLHAGKPNLTFDVGNSRMFVFGHKIFLESSTGYCVLAPVTNAAELACNPISVTDFEAAQKQNSTQRLDFQNTKNALSKEQYQYLIDLTGHTPTGAVISPQQRYVIAWAKDSIYLADFWGTEFKRLWSNTFIYRGWSPNEQWLAFEDGSRLFLARPTDIQVFPVEGRWAKVIVWSPDEKYLLIEREPKHSLSLYSIDTRQSYHLDLDKAQRLIVWVP